MQFKSSIGYTESIFVTTTYMTPYLQTYPISKIRLLGTNLSPKKSALYPNLPHTKNTKCTLTSSKYGNIRFVCIINYPINSSRCHIWMVSTVRTFFPVQERKARWTGHVHQASGGAVTFGGWLMWKLHSAPRVKCLSLFKKPVNLS